MKEISEKCLAIFFILGYIFIPLTSNGRDWQFQVTNFLFSVPITFLQNNFYPNAINHVDFSSDTIALNLLLFVLFLTAISSLLTLQLTRFKTSKIINISRLISCFYIAFILLKYGFDKIFKAQFYLPEPNILYTQFGNLTKDILYWSTIGTSYFYSLSMGIIEVVIAILILYNRTRVMGLLFSLAIFTNIILINFGFDISVKTFSTFLFSASLFAVYPYLKSILNFLIFQNKEQLPSHENSIITNTFIKIWIKIIIIGLMFLQILYPYFQQQNFNDDKQKRSLLHGVYKVNKIIKNNDTLNLIDFPITKIFIHRNNYLLFEGKNNQMTDYHFENDTIKKQLKLQDYNKNEVIVNYDFIKKDSTFKLKFKNYYIVSKAINWRNLPALQNKTHYTIDEIQ